MNVTHLITTICRGGAEPQLLTLAREQARFGHEVTVYFLKGDPELEKEFLDSGVRVKNTLVSKTFLQQILVFRNEVRRSNSIIHAHLPKSELIASIARSSNQLIISRHNSEPFFPGAPTFISRFLSKLVSLRSSGCISISNAVKNYLISNKELVSSKKHWVVEYGFNPSANIHERKDIPKSSVITFGTVSRLVPQKDLTTLLTGFGKFTSKKPSNLLIVGKGPEKINLQTFSQHLNIDQHVSWLDQTTNVYETMSQMDVFCLTSKYEGFGLVLLEAMQSELPIIAANNSAISEVLGDSYPYLFTTSDTDDLFAKMELLTSERHRKDAIAYLQERLKKFSPFVMATKIDAIYMECLNQIPQNKSL